MRRLRFFRYLLLALLLPFLVLLGIMFRQPPEPHTLPLSPLSGPRADKIQFQELSGNVRILSLEAGSVEQDESGGLRLRDVRRLEINRKDRPPLIVRADAGNVSGTPGQRLMRLEGGVEVADEEEDLALSLPTLEVNEAVGEARSLGAVRFRAPSYEGEAESIVYGLEGQPSVLSLIRATASDGSVLVAEKATLLDGVRDVLLEGSVSVEGMDSRLDAEKMRIRRGDDGKLRNLVATGEVRAVSAADAGPPSRARSERLEMKWNAGGTVIVIRLGGDAFVERGQSGLRAARIDCERASADDPWTIEAGGNAYATSRVKEGSAFLSADRVTARLTGERTLNDAEAEGNVRFDSGGTSGEADRVTFEPTASRTKIVLHASARTRARLARERNRVAAELIETDPEGTHLVAEGRVEASVLPATGPDGRGPTRGLFAPDDAVHFVAARLEGDPSRNRLTFSGSVRGWQGERNLAADRVDLDQDRDLLTAEGDVITRIPRDATGAISEADFVHISSEHLVYAGESSRARYTGGVRVRQAEGWMRSEELEIDLDEGGGGAKEIRADGTVRFEFRTSDSGGLPTPVTGEGDRLVYVPRERLVTVYGDRSRASVRRPGEGGGTTTGRVLLYRLDTGSLEVRSGEGDRARIRTSEESEP